MENILNNLFEDDVCSSVDGLILGLTLYETVCKKLISILMEHKEKKVSQEWFISQLNKLIEDETIHYGGYDV